MLSDTRKPFKTGQSKGITLPASMQISDDWISMAASDKLILMNTNGEVPENKLLEFFMQYVHTAFQNWCEEKKRASKSPIPRMFEGFSFGFPHNYKAIAALKWQGDKHPQSYNLYRNVTVFHSFLSDDPETFQYTTVRAIKEVLPFSQLSNFVDSFNVVDYDQFDITYPILSTDSTGLSLENVDVSFENGSKAICYRHAFKFFVG